MRVSLKKCLMFSTLVLVLLLPGCLKNKSGYSSVYDRAKKTGKIIVGTSANCEPFEYVFNGKIQGIDIDIANIIAKRLSSNLEVKDIIFDNLISDLNDYECDFVASAMSINDLRSEEVDFSEPYYVNSQRLVVLSGTGIHNFDDLFMKNIAVQKGTTSDMYVNPKLKDSTFIQYDRYDEAVNSLLNQEVSAIIVDDFTADKIVERSGGKIFKLSNSLAMESYAIAVSKGETELLQVINNVIREIKDNGELENIINSYK